MPVRRNISKLDIAPAEIPSCDSDMADAKRARSEVRSFADISVDALKLKVNHTADKKVVAKIPTGDFNLTPSGWLTSRFGFDLNCKFGKPSFLGGEKPAENVTAESLSMRISLDAETANFFKELDEKVCSEYTAIQKDAQWQPLVTEDLLFNTGSSVKIHVVLKLHKPTGGPLTKLALVTNKTVDRGEGWEFLKEYLDKKISFYNTELKVCLRPRSVWHTKDGKAGISLEATRLVLRPHVEVDPFADDDELIA